jgi:transposase
MKQQSGPAQKPGEQFVQEQFSAEDKIRIVQEGLGGDDSIAELCRREGNVQNLYYRWSTFSKSA